MGAHPWHPGLVAFGITGYGGTDLPLHPWHPGTGRAFSGGG